MRNLLGLVIIVFGIGFLLEQFNVPGADRIMGTWWPLLIMAVGVIAWSSNRRHWFGPLIIVLVGLILLLDQLNLSSGSAWNYFWPVMVIIFGGRILMGRSGEGQMTKKDTGPANANVLFSGIDRRVTGQFSSSDVSAWFGGVKLDLRDAQFSDHSSLHVTAGFGGIELFVPKNIRVVSQVTPMFGGLDDKTSPDSGASKTLTISGSALFGGVSVKN